MRPDMHHLLVERGHSGRAWSTGKGWRGRARFRHADPEDGDGWLPPRHRPQFSENLAPLRRYLAAQVGRPWGLVHSEICTRIDAGSAVQYHILQHLYDDLAVRVREDGSGVLWYVRRWGGEARLDARWGPSLYACPRSGLLRRVRRRRVPETVTPLDRLPGDAEDRDHRLLAGQWYAITWGRDPLAGEPLIVHKRQLNRRQLRDLGLRS